MAAHHYYSMISSLPKMADPFAFSTHPNIPPLDLSCFHGDQLDCHFGVPSTMFDASIPLLDMDMDIMDMDMDIMDMDIDMNMDSFLPWPHVNIDDQNLQLPIMLQEELLVDKGDELGVVWNNIDEIMSSGGFDEKKKQPPLILLENGDSDTACSEAPVVLKKARSCQEEEEEENKNGSRSTKLSMQTLSQYFYMPITQAARELNMGLTLLKKRCRELGIRRWPHRKLMSLKTLMKNVQEGNESEEKKREWMDLLEHERRQIEERPDLKMHDKTKRLRQSCFKENYKKRKRMSMGMEFEATYEEEEELRCLLLSHDCLSPLSDIIGS